MRIREITFRDFRSFRGQRRISFLDTRVASRPANFQRLVSVLSLTHLRCPGQPATFGGSKGTCPSLSIQKVTSSHQTGSTC